MMEEGFHCLFLNSYRLAGKLRISIFIVFGRTGPKIAPQSTV